MIPSAYIRIGTQAWQERPGLSFEDLAPGMRFRHRPGLTVSQQDNADEALDMHNAAMLHYDAHYAAQTTWKRPLYVSTSTLQRVVGMTGKTYGDRAAITGFDEIALTAPVFGGDTLYAESEVLSVDATGDGPTGRVALLVRCVKADGTATAAIRLTAEIYRRDRAPDAPAGSPDPDPRFAGWHADAEGVLTEQAGIWFEEFRAGDRFVHGPRRSFHPHECVDYARRAFSADPRTLDLEWIARHGGGRMRVPETFLVGASAALSTRTFGRVVANLAWRDVRLAPVFAGDTLRAESTVLESRESRSRPGEGILSVETRATNQHGEEVVSFRRNLLVYRRAAPTPYAAAGY